MTTTADHPTGETTTDSVSVCVIGSQFITPNPLEFIVDTNSRGNLVITDINHKIILKVKPCNTIFHQQRMLLRADDTPIAMLRDKFMSEHKRWKVYKGDSTADSDIIFSTKTAYPFHLKSKSNVQVVLANKTRKKEGGFDFLLKGSWSKRNCTISMADSSTIIARMREMQASSENIRFVKDKFMVEVIANVDYALIVALIAIVDAMKSSKMADQIVEVVIDGMIDSALGGVGTS